MHNDLFNVKKFDVYVSFANISPIFQSRIKMGADILPDEYS